MKVLLRLHLLAIGTSSWLLSEQDVMGKVCCKTPDLADTVASRGLLKELTLLEPVVSRLPYITRERLLRMLSTPVCGRSCAVPAVGIHRDAAICCERACVERLTALTDTGHILMVKLRLCSTTTLWSVSI